jgi:hypothetical protein
MHLAVVIPDSHGPVPAGVRIRYQRIADQAQAQGHQVTILPLALLETDRTFAAQAYVFSKCHDVRSVLLAHALAARGRLVGVDLFDDYFSQTGNPRFVHLRQWLAQIIPALGFGLCSTPALAGLWARLTPGLPVHVMHDPAPPPEAPADLAARLARKAARARATRVIDIAWFGTGDNPHLPVGIQDLAAHAGLLTRLGRQGHALRLHLLTNRRALTPDRLAQIARLPLPAHVTEWSEDAETALLHDSLLAFLPVNAQGFSVGKSLNRAVTALSAGAQVLSAGYPLYAAMGDLIYRDPAQVLTDLDRDTLRHGGARLPAFAAMLARLADPGRECARLAAFLDGLAPPAARPWPGPGVVAVIHGARSSEIVHRGIRNIGHMSVASPLVHLPWNFDVTPVRDPQGRHTDLLLSQRGVNRLPPAWAARLADLAFPDGRSAPGVRLLPADLPPGPALLDAGPLPPEPLHRLTALAGQDAAMARTAALLRAVYGPVTFFVAEAASPWLSPLPTGVAA